MVSARINGERSRGDWKSLSRERERVKTSMSGEEKKRKRKEGTREQAAFFFALSLFRSIFERESSLSLLSFLLSATA